MVSTLLVFVMTWFLHAYQWFWLRGTVFLVWQDVLFWAILGGLVVVNAIYEDQTWTSSGLRQTDPHMGRPLPSDAADVRYVLRDLRVMVVLDERIGIRMAVAVECARWRDDVRSRARHHSSHRGDHHRRDDSRQSSGGDRSERCAERQAGPPRRGRW